MLTKGGYFCTHELILMINIVLLMYVVMRSVGVIEQIRHGNHNGCKLFFIAHFFDSKLCRLLLCVNRSKW
jgi:hypothetical protein